MYMGAQLKSKPLHTGTLSATTWLHRRQYFRPAVFLRHLRLISPPFPQAKILTAFQIC